VAVVVRPVIDFDGNVVGVLAGRPDLDKLSEIMAERSGLGQTGETYLLDGNHTLLTANRFGEMGIDVQTVGADRSIDSQRSGSGSYTNYRDVSVIGFYRWLPELQLALLAEQEQAEAFRGLYGTLGALAGVAILAAVGAVGVALRIARSIANPLTDLAETATEIADGDLEQVVQIESGDEIGRLARAFNVMTTQLRELIGSLEQRVADRTHELEHRSAYLEMAAEVGRAASSILETDRLAQEVVALVLERLDFYYVGLFLVDETGEQVVLQANAGRTGRPLPAVGYRLPVGKGSMIGWCIENRQVRVALESREDPERWAEPDLPDTRSEAALPLQSRGRVLGALTVQHTRPDAFDRETVAVLQVLADQVAVALDNAQLFTERQQALEATQRAYGDLTREAWRQMLQARPDLSFRSDEHGVIRAGDVWRPEMEQALRTGQTVQDNGPDVDGRQPLAVPIKVRGEVVGVLDTYKPVGAGAWTLEEIALVEAIANQLDSALESARLYQDTQRRAAREQAIRQVTDRMRRAVDVEAILQNTVSELTKALGTPRAYVRLGTEVELQDGSTSQGEGVRNDA
jgi:GAF domain-containing protein/HAMP domain-containing protein